MLTDWQLWLLASIAAFGVTVVVLRRLGHDRQERERLQQQVAELDQFTRTVAHDLRGPLATLRGLLARVESPATELVAARRLAAQAEDLVQSLLTLARAGDVPGTPVDVPLAEVTREAWDALTLGSPRHDQLIIAADLPVIRGDRSRLRQVMQNLLENALAATDQQPRPQIRVGCDANHDEPACVFVEDNGRGLTPGDDPIRNAHGWGLKIVQKIIAAHGGRLWMEPQSPGCRVCFTVVTGTA